MHLFQVQFLKYYLFVVDQILLLFSFAAFSQGEAKTNNQWLKQNDIVTLEIEQLGKITNKIIL